MTSETSAIPSFSKPSPDERRLGSIMRRIAEHESEEVPILSAYVDPRPEAHAERPGERPSVTTVQNELKRLIDEHPAHSDARASLEADRDRLLALLDTDEARQVEGIALFAADALGLWEAIGTAQPLDVDVTTGRIADLYGLARVTDDNEAAIVALADTNTCRLFAWRRGHLVEIEGPDEGNPEHQRHDQGGWSQARFQRHIDEQDKRFARRVAEAIDRLVEHERARELLIASDERARSVLVDALSERSRSLLADARHIGMRATLQDVQAEVGPLIEALEEERSRQVADRAVAGDGGQGLGVLGMEKVRTALERGAVSELVFDHQSAGDLDRWTRAELVRGAILTDAQVVVSYDHEGLRAADGVGATLRFEV